MGYRKNTMFFPKIMIIFANEIWRKKQRLKDLEEQKYENY